MAERPAGANKYSIYQQRDLDSDMVDWGAIASDITTGLTAVAKDRENRKDAITKSTQDTLDKLNEIQDVDNTDIQALLISGSDNSKKALMEANTLLKAGLMSEKDYALIVQQQKSGYSSLNNLAKNADATWKVAQERLLAGDSSALEEWNNGTLLGFGNLNNTQLISNPTTGELMMVRMIKNPAHATDPSQPEYIMPDPSVNPENFQSPSQMVKATKFKMNSTNSKKLAAVATKGLASVITSTIKGGTLSGKDVTEITSFKQLFDIDTTGGLTIEGEIVTFDDFMDGQVDAIVGPADQFNNMNAAQVLAEDMGYEIGGSCQEVKDRINNQSFDCSKHIQATNKNGSPVVTLTPEQQKAARDKIRLEMLITLDNETKIKALSGQQEKSDPLGDKREEEDLNRFSFIKQIDTMLGDNLTNANTEATNFVDMYNRQETDATKHLRGIQVTEDELIIRRQSGDPYIIPRRYEDENGNIVNRTREEVISEAFNPLLGENVSKESISEIIKKQQYTFKGRREDIDDLNYRLKQSKLPEIVTKPTALTDNKQPIEYLREFLKNKTTGDTTTAKRGTIRVGKRIENVVKSLIPKGLIDMLVAEGFDNPLDTFKVVDKTFGQGDGDQISFKVGDEEFLITIEGYDNESQTSIPGGQTGDNLSHQVIYDEIMRVIESGIGKVEGKRRADKFTQFDDYATWKAAALKADAAASTSYKDYQEWKKTQRK
jgi:hypothetical protein